MAETRREFEERQLAFARAYTEKESKKLKMVETRKEFEERLLTELLEETGEPLCNILIFAASYLEGRHSVEPRESDLVLAKALLKYNKEMATRIQEVRE